MMTYPEVYGRLNFETAIIVFLKKNGDIRLMLGTRNMSTISIYHGFQGKSLGGHDNRCNINNGNIAVFDLIIGDARAFHIDRLVSIEFHNVINTKEELDNLIEYFAAFKEQYESTQPMTLDMQMLD